jgi:biotin carboxyl carrier protein
MKLTVNDQGQQNQVEIERNGGTLKATVEGRHYEIEAVRLVDGGWLLTHAGRVFDTRVVFADGNPELAQITVGSRQYQFKVRDPRRLAARGSAGTADGAAQLISLMPGKVVGILVQIGEEVTTGQAILVVEAMKMQNELKSPRAGVVRELRAAVGATVNSGDVLAVIE